MAMRQRSRPIIEEETNTKRRKINYREEEAQEEQEEHNNDSEEMDAEDAQENGVEYEEEKVESAEEENEDEEDEEEDEEGRVQKKKSRTESARRGLRKDYLDLLTRTQVDAKVLMEPGSAELQERINEANTLFKQVCHAREATLDAQFLKLGSKLGVGQAQQTKLNTRMGINGADMYAIASVSDVYDAFKKGFSKNSSDKDKDRSNNNREEDVNEEEEEDTGCEINWTRAGEFFSGCYRRFPAISFMNGPLQAEPKVRKITQRTQKDEISELVRPNQIQEQEREENETSKQANLLYKKLRNIKEKTKKQTPNTNTRDNQVDILELILDEDSFTKTIENIFYFSFLIKDGFVTVDTDTNTQTIYTDINPNRDTNTNTSAQTIRQQCIVPFDYNTWKRMVALRKQQAK